MRKVWVLMALGGLSLGAALPSLATETFVIDQYEVKEPSIPADAVVVIKEFSTENTDFGKLKKPKQKETATLMRRAAPTAFQEALVQRLSELAAFAGVTAYEEGELPEGSLLLEGEFTILSPGNRAKRYWAMGASGKSRICISGHVVEASGKELATFADYRTGAGLWTFGGNSAGLMMADVDHSAEYLAGFMNAWVRGELPELVSKKKVK